MLCCLREKNLKVCHVTLSQPLTFPRPRLLLVYFQESSLPFGAAKLYFKSGFPAEFVTNAECDLLFLDRQIPRVRGDQESSL